MAKYRSTHITPVNTRFKQKTRVVGFSRALRPKGRVKRVIVRKVRKRLYIDKNGMIIRKTEKVIK